MKYLSPYSVSNRSAGSPSGIGAGGSNQEYGRVTEVILTGTDIKKINSIRYSPLTNQTGKSEEADKGIYEAYPIGSDFFTIPLIGEVVKISTVPSPKVDSLVTVPTAYYERIINYWNTPKNGLFFDTDKAIDASTLNKSVEINPVKTNIGDTLIQGRDGQVIVFTREQDSGKPRIFLGTGRPFEAPSISQVELDLDKANSGIEFTTDGTSKLKTLKKFEKSHRRSEKPKTSDTYKGEQILVNTGRVVLNSKNDSTLISAKESISLSANTLNQEADKEICLEAPKIYLGSDALNSPNPEPVLLGHKVEEYLLEIVEELIRITDSLSKAATTSGDTLPLLTKTGAASSKALIALKSTLNPGGESTLKSKKSFTK